MHAKIITCEVFLEHSIFLGVLLYTQLLHMLPPGDGEQRVIPFHVFSSDLGQVWDGWEERHTTHGE